MRLVLRTLSPLMLAIMVSTATFGLTYGGGGPAISTQRDQVNTIIDRNGNQSSLAYGEGLTFTSNSAYGYAFRRNEPYQGVGFYLASGGLSPNDTFINPTYINVGSRVNGDYTGSYTILYSDRDGKWHDDGQIVRYTIILVGQQPVALPCPALRNVQGGTRLPVKQEAGSCTFTIGGLDPGTTLRCLEAFVCEFGKPAAAGEPVRHTVVQQGPAEDTGDTLTLHWVSESGLNYPDCQVFVRQKQASPWPVYLRNETIGYVINPSGPDDGCVPFFR